MTGQVEYKPLLTIEETPAGEGADPPPAPPAKTVTVDGTPLKVEPEINNLEGVLSTLQKYQKFGNVKDIEKAIEASRKLTALNEAVTADGFDLETLPDQLKQITAKSKTEEALEAELSKRYESRIQLAALEHQKKVTDLENRLNTVTQSLTDRLQSDAVRPHFMANAKPEAQREWTAYWNDIKQHIVFDPENPGKIERLLDAKGEPLVVTVNGETRTGNLDDLFTGFIAGEYGTRIGYAMLPINGSRGGGSISPATNSRSSISSADLGKLPPAQLREMKSKVASGEVRVIQA
ncbi:MAG: hypothetical protein AAGA46_00495 [Cyanobacteria bacterium P01_F01_bin.13]